VKRFTAYRHDLAKRGTHNEVQMNAEHEPQFEGVVFTDGTVALRWLTACKSTSVWDSLATMLAIHGHPEYGTDIIWHDFDAVPQEWLDALDNAKARGLLK
jgi:hypothetical protein